jgi:hypothetical protein
MQPTSLLVVKMWPLVQKSLMTTGLDVCGVTNFCVFTALTSRPTIRNHDHVMAQASHSRGLGLHPHQSMWHLWWTKWHWDRFYSEFFSFPLSVSFHCGSLHTHLLSGERTLGPLEARVQRHILTWSTWTWTAAAGILQASHSCVMCS